MHAIVTNVELALGRDDEALAMLNQLVVPQAKASAGFTGGYWLHSADQAFGMSVEFFESQAAAEAAVATRREGPPPGAPVSVISVRLMDVAASA